LTTASVVGREFDFQLLAALSAGITEDQMLGAIDEAISVRLIEALPDRMEAYRFSHALIQQTLSEELTPSRRVRLHARIGEALEGFYGANATAHATELAHHFAEAEPVLGAEKLVHYSMFAGEGALASYAWEEAQAHFERALAVKETGNVDSETAALLSGLGQAQVAMALIPESVVNLSRAFDYYVESGDAPYAVAIADHPYSQLLLPNLKDLISRALDLVTPESLQAGRVLCNLGICLGSTRDGYLAAQDAFGRALAIARREHDQSLEMRVLSSSANIDGFHLRWTETLDKSLAAIELALLVDEPVSKLRGHYWAGFSLLCGVGDVAGARSHASQMLTDAEQLRDRLWISQALFLQISIFSLIGDWENALEHSDRCITRFPNNAVVLAQRSLIEYELGNPSQGQVYLERHLQSIRTGRLDSAALLAFINLTVQCTARDHLEETRERAQAMLSSSQNFPAAQASARCALGLIAVHSGDGPAAGEEYRYLAPHRDSAFWRLDRVVDRLLGLLAHTMGNLDQAAAHFEDTLAFCRKAGYRPELAPAERVRRL
jgi:tetratricopeptide (TPR) repeat protein